MRIQKWIDTFKDKQGKAISRILFKSYSTQEEVTKQFNPNAYNRWLKRKDNKKTSHYALPIVNFYFKEWKDKEFLEKSIPLRELNFDQSFCLPEEYRKKIKFLPKKFALSILNLNPLFKYCAEKNIVFSKEEKESGLFIFDFRNNLIREAILTEFPEEDIITATLKFYVKNYILRYTLLLRDIEENPKKYEQYKEKAEELNNPKSEMGKLAKKDSQQVHRKLNKRYGSKNNMEKWNTFKSFVWDHKFGNTPKDIMFRMYIIQLEKNKELVLSIDKKILSALDVLPES